MYLSTIFLIFRIDFKTGRAVAGLTDIKDLGTQSGQLKYREFSMDDVSIYDSNFTALLIFGGIFFKTLF